MCSSDLLVSLVVYRIAGLFTGECGFGIWTVVAMVIIVFFFYMLFRPAKTVESKITNKVVTE